MPIEVTGPFNQMISVPLAGERHGDATVHLTSGGTIDIELTTPVQTTAFVSGSGNVADTDTVAAVGDVIDQQSALITLFPATPANVTDDGTTATIVIGAPSVHAGSYQVTLADLAAGPVSVSPPIVSVDGSPAIAGKTLTGAPGIWAQDPAATDPAVVGQWLVGTLAIPGATGATLADAPGGSITYREEATDENGARQHASAAAVLGYSDNTPPDVTNIVHAALDLTYDVEDNESAGNKHVGGYYDDGLNPEPTSLEVFFGIGADTRFEFDRTYGNPAQVFTIPDPLTTKRYYWVDVNDAGKMPDLPNSVLITIASTPPTLGSMVPEPGTSGHGVAAPFVLTFSENVQAGAADTVTLWNLDGAAAVETFDLSAGTGTNGGTIGLAGAVVTITPGAALTADTKYSLRYGADFVRDLAGAPCAANNDDSLLFGTHIGPVITVGSGQVTIELLSPLELVDFVPGDAQVEVVAA